MKKLIVFLVPLILSGCAGTRVLVKDCQDLAGAGDMKNCELIRKL